jgi:hypothetical protein
MMNPTFQWDDLQNLPPVPFPSRTIDPSMLRPPSLLYSVTLDMPPLPSDACDVTFDACDDQRPSKRQRKTKDGRPPRPYSRRADDPRSRQLQDVAEQAGRLMGALDVTALRGKAFADAIEGCLGRTAVTATASPLFPLTRKCITDAVHTEGCTQLNKSRAHTTDTHMNDYVKKLKEATDKSIDAFGAVVTRQHDLLEQMYRHIVVLTTQLTQPGGGGGGGSTPPPTPVPTTMTNEVPLGATVAKPKPMRKRKRAVDE